MLKTIHLRCPSCQDSIKAKTKHSVVFCSCGFKITNFSSGDAGCTQEAIAGRTPSLLPIVKPFGPGDAMTEIMHSLGIREKVNCSCRALAATMNELGIDGCERKRSEIIAQLKQSAEKYSWLETLRVATQNVINPFAISLVLSGDLYDALFDSAIKRAKEFQRQSMADSVKDFAQGKLGIVTPVYNRIGGTETYWRMFHRHMGIAGLATTTKPQWLESDFPIGWGNEPIQSLASSVENLIVWGVTDAVDATKGPRRIAMHHGSLASAWANSVFENQLQWCEDAVAINPEVAKHYGVTYIANAIDTSRIVGTPNPKTKKVVLWLHRDAQEKRPWLVRRIAAALPDDWMMIASLPANRAGKNLHCIGPVDHPGDWLATADVFLSTADQEGFGYSVAEAMAAGVPVVSSPFGIAANSQLVEQVQSEIVMDWVDAILRAGPKVDSAKRYVMDCHSEQVWADAWRKKLSH